MALTEDQKTELLTHFSSKGFAEAMNTMVVGQRELLAAQLVGGSKDDFYSEAMNLISIKSGLRTLDGLLEELSRLRRAATE